MPVNGEDEVVRAAGGVVVESGGGAARVVVVHRPQYDDWSLPKGKCEPGESSEECALREVEEETGLRCRLVLSLGTTAYRDGRQRRKEVQWWLMRPESGEMAARNEVDAASWISPAEALEVLSYELDRRLLRPLLEESRVWVVRHASAGEPFRGGRSDQQRPLDETGLRQARALAETLGRESIGRIVSSPYLRCVQTVEPLASVLSKPVERLPGLGEGRRLEGVEPLLVSGESVVACTHGDVLDELLDELRRAGLAAANAKAQKGSVWELRSRAGLIEAARYLPLPDQL